MGALLVGVDALWRADDQSLSVSKLIKMEDFGRNDDSELKFVENVVEFENTNALLIVFTGGEVWSLFENEGCQFIARLASPSPRPSLVDSQILCLEDNRLLNLKGDAPAELYSYVDKKLVMVGRQHL